MVFTKALALAALRHTAADELGRVRSWLKNANGISWTQQYGYYTGYIDLRPAVMKAAVELVQLYFLNNIFLNFINRQPFNRVKSLVSRNEC